MTEVANYDTMTPAMSRACRVYTAITHVCCVCRHPWHSPDKITATKVERAVQVNRDGPYCIICLHLEMAARHAEARGYNGIRNAMTDWKAKVGS
jgi:hypothetical protein